MELNYFSLFTYLDLIEKVDIKDIPTNLEELKAKYPIEIDRYSMYIIECEKKWGKIVNE